MIFDSYDISPVLFGTGKCPRETWDYFTENELLPGAVRWHQFKFLFNLRGDNGAETGGLAVDTNLGWKGAEKYVAIVPQIFDLWQDPQERYDIFMTNWTEHTWIAPVMQAELTAGDENFHRLSAAKAAKRRLQRPNHHFRLREIWLAPGSTQEGRRHDYDAHRKLIQRESK